MNIIIKYFFVFYIIYNLKKHNFKKIKKMTNVSYSINDLTGRPGGN